MKTIVFDLEAVFFETVDWDNVQDLWDAWPFGISVGATKASDTGEILTWLYHSRSGMPHWAWSAKTASEFLDYLWGRRKNGYIISSINGTGFDFRLLYRITHDERAKTLCYDHFDPCFQMVAQYGFPVGMAAMSKMLGLSPKEEDGAEASDLWKAGEYERVIKYVKGDVERTETIVHDIINKGRVQWVTKTGALTSRPIRPLLVKDCLSLPMPDTAWMKPDPERKPITRETMAGWLAPGEE